MTEARSLVFVLLCLASVVLANFEYHERTFGNENEKYVELRVGMVTIKDSWAGDNEIYLAYNVTLQSVDNSATNDVYSAIYHSSRAGSIGWTNAEGQEYLCCTKSIEKASGCSGTGLIVNDDHIFSQKYTVGSGLTQAQVTKNPEKSGIYYVLFVSCPQSQITIDGAVTWMNPYGHLSAELYPFIWFFSFLAILYTGALVYWIVLSLLHRKELLMLQNWIAIVIVLGLVECVTWYIDFRWGNSTGKFNWNAITIGIFSSTLKRAVSRLLVLVVSLGFGVVKGDLGTMRNRVFLLTFLYFVVSAIQQLVDTAMREGDGTEFLLFISTIIIFPGVLLDTIFYWWTLVSVSRTIQQLQIRKQSVKLDMYKKFFVLLAASGIAAGLIVLLQFFVMAMSSVDDHWRNWWMYNASFHLVYYAVLLGIVILWRPTDNNTRYAFIEGNDNEIMLEPMTQRDRENLDISSIGQINIPIDIPSMDDEDLMEEIAKMD